MKFSDTAAETVSTSQTYNEESLIDSRDSTEDLERFWHGMKEGSDSVPEICSLQPKLGRASEERTSHSPMLIRCKSRCRIYVKQVLCMSVKYNNLQQRLSKSNEADFWLKGSEETVP